MLLSVVTAAAVATRKQFSTPLRGAAEVYVFGQDQFDPTHEHRDAYMHITPRAATLELHGPVAPPSADGVALQGFMHGTKRRWMGKGQYWNPYTRHDAAAIYLNGSTTKRILLVGGTDFQATTNNSNNFPFASTALPLEIAPGGVIEGRHTVQKIPGGIPGGNRVGAKAASVTLKNHERHACVFGGSSHNTTSGGQFVLKSAFCIKDDGNAIKPELPPLVCNLNAFRTDNFRCGNVTTELIANVAAPDVCGCQRACAYNHNCKGWEFASSEGTSCYLYKAPCELNSTIADTVTYTRSVPKDASLNALASKVHRGISDTIDWDDIDDMPEPRMAHAAAAYEGKLYVLGGRASVLSSANCTDTVMEYNVISGKWSYGPPMPARLCFHAAAPFNGRLYVSGGYHDTTANNQEPSQRTYAMAPDANGTMKWTPQYDLDEPRAKHLMVPYGTGSDCSSLVVMLGINGAIGSANTAVLDWINVLPIARVQEADGWVIILSSKSSSNVTIPTETSFDTAAAVVHHGPSDLTCASDAYKLKHSPPPSPPAPKRKDHGQVKHWHSGAKWALGIACVAGAALMFYLCYAVYVKYTEDRWPWLQGSMGSAMTTSNLL